MTRPPLWTTFTDEAATTYSWSRVTVTVLVGCAVLWGSFLVWKNHAIPDFTSLALLIGAIYGINRAAEAFENRPPAQPVQPQLPVQQNVNVDAK